MTTSPTRDVKINNGKMRYKVLLLSIFILSSCSAKWHLKQAEKKGAITKTDTVFTDIPVFIEEVKRDSIFFSLPGDTVRIEKDRLRVTYVRLPGDSVYIEGECQADTVYKEVATLVYRKIQCPDKPQKIKWWHLLIAGLVGAGVIAVIKR
jgi:hypothetical protein